MSLRSLSQSSDPIGLSDVTIGVVTALESEYRAAYEALGCSTSLEGPKAQTVYRVGRITPTAGPDHIVAVTLLPKIGNQAALLRVTRMADEFPNLEHIIMCGIAAAIPDPSDPENHVRLGDIVVCDADGVRQYDRGKVNPDGIEPKAPSRPASEVMLEAVRRMRAEDSRSWESTIDELEDRLGKAWLRPSVDVLLDNDGPEELAHPLDAERREGRPRIFIGPIASGDMVVKSAKFRNEIAETFGARALEMEGSGLAGAARAARVDYQVVRGTCDYADKGKNKVWQRHAAVIAAAFTRSMIEAMPGPTRSTSSVPVPPTVLEIASPDLKASARAQMDDIRNQLRVLEYQIAFEKARSLQQWVSSREDLLGRDLVIEIYLLLGEVAKRKADQQRASGEDPDPTEAERIMRKLEHAIEKA